MKLYTLQTLKAWEVSKSKGYLVGNTKYSMEDYKNEYEWMKNQMSKRLPNYKGEQPIWMWFTPESININEIILDEDYVLLEVDINSGEVVISHFEAWHYVLNNWYLSKDEISCPKEASWEGIFDLDKLSTLEFDLDEINLQATTGKIDIRNIKVVKYFVSSIYNNN